MFSCAGCKRKNNVGVPRKPTDKNFIGKSIAIAGYSVRAINSSAKACVLTTLTIDCFADMDLRRLADEFVHVNLETFRNAEGKLEQPSAYYLNKAIEKLAPQIRDYDYFVIGSGFENYPGYLKQIETFDNYLGNSSRTIEKIRKLDLLYPFLQQNKISFPKTSVIYVDSPDTPSNKSNMTLKIYGTPNRRIITRETQGKISQTNTIKEIYDKNISKFLHPPFVLKSEKSGGGFGIYLIRDRNEFVTNLKNLIELKKYPFVVQEYIKGENLSSSFLANGSKA
ncbi:MAG: ATP-grasp domain-containing protein, partial [Candidatus Lokiarchaeota archaeon]|nr:ATP-grasp domain-containing protein [Candidatus Lokiarchaeota archaeon]